jgi:hypothetical protein
MINRFKYVCNEIQRSKQWTCWIKFLCESISSFQMEKNYINAQNTYNSIISSGDFH